MGAKRTVRVRVESRGGGQQLAVTSEGELYRTAAHYYVRYPESDPAMGRTMTTVKWNEREIRVIRHGDVQSEQTFAPGQRKPGSYRFPQGQLSLETYTHTMSPRTVDGIGDLAWSYDLYTDGRYAGRYKLKLVIEDIQDIQEGTD
jgi:uncharacterized beta-barrel protein YwiB (DUF1934 family)